MCCRPRAGRVEEEVRQARAVELIAQKRLLDLHMRSQVCAHCCSVPYIVNEHGLVDCCCQRPCLHNHGGHVLIAITSRCAQMLECTATETMERPDLSCTNLAHHELKSGFCIVIIIIIIHYYYCCC